MKRAPLQLSVVVPCHNEEENIPLILEKFLKVYKEHPLELIVVNNASTDRTQERIDELLSRQEYDFIRAIQEPVPGYGRAIVTGLRVARGDVLAWTHADLQTDPADTVRALQLFEAQEDRDRVVVKGRRVNRRFGAWAFTFGMSIIASVVLRGVYSDINAQPKMFSRRFFERDMTDPPEDFSLDLYLLALARQKTYLVVTLPVFFASRVHGESKWAFSFRSKCRTIIHTVRYIFHLRKKLDRDSH